MFPGTKTKTVLALGAHTFSDAVTLLSSIAVPRSSQTEKQFRKLQKQLRHFTSQASPDFRLKVITYGEARFWNMPAYVDLDPTLAGVVDRYVTKAKAA